MLYIIKGKHHIDGRDIFAVFKQGQLSFLRYVPFRGAVAEHGGKSSLWTLDEATRFSREEADEALAAELKNREGRPANQFWVHDLEVVELTSALLEQA